MNRSYIDHINYLRMWRKAVKEIGLCAEEYVVGGAAENRLNILSDIDVAIVLCEELDSEEIKRIRREIVRVAVDRYGLLWDYPVE